MATLSGNSSGSTQIQNSGSEREEQRKRKRMESNRESARRSRMRKQQHLDELGGKVSQLSKENEEILKKTNVTTEHYLKIESENLILRAQMDELSQRLQSLNDILNYINMNNRDNNMEMFESENGFGPGSGLGPESLMNPWYLNQPPIMASADMFQY